MSPKQFKTWDQYTEEAKLEPFELPVSKDETLVFQPPSGTALIQIARGLRRGDLEAILFNLVGEEWPRVEQLLAKAGHKALPNLVEDLMDHFDLYEPVSLRGPGGGTVTRKRPREIQAMLNQGYVPVGEAPSSS